MSSMLYERLKKKGWSDEEIEKAARILGEAKTAPIVSKTTPFLYWAGLFLAVLGNMIVSVTLVPFLIVMQGTSLYFIVGLLGLVFGSLVSVLLHDIEDVDPKHRIMGWLFVPALALINIYIMVRIASEFKQLIFASNPNSAAAVLDPIIISVVYSVCFVLPYLIKQWLGRK